MALDPKTMSAETRGETVMVGCKHPAGIVLNLNQYEKISDTNVRLNLGKMTVTLKGWARRQGDPDHTHGGYALTSVPRDFWEEWLRTHADFPMLKDGTILPPHSDATSQARAHADVEALFRPVKRRDPENPRDPGDSRLSNPREVATNQMA